jgi:alginate O-acetyltransferase complex protein AlgI
VVQSPWHWLALAATVIVYWCLPARLRMGFLGSASLGYLLWAEFELTGAVRTIPVLLALALAFYLLGPVVARPGPGPRRVLSVLVLAALAWLAWFKYVPPIVEALSGHFALAPAVIPIGISYYTFKLIHYGVEVARGNIKDRSLGSFFGYVLLFPIFTAGPIERYDHFLANRAERLQGDDLLAGLTRIVHGLVKKFVILELMLLPLFGSNPDGAALVSHLDRLSTVQVWGFAVLTYLAAYLDFSAYSDLAIGSSRLFGIRIMENFRWPVLATNIGDFWKRWHMTLAGWCQAYVYMPMIGLTRNPYAAVYATFIAIGLWHAGTLHWLAWGAWHATGMVVYLAFARAQRRKGAKAPARGLSRLWGWPFTAAFVAAGFLITALNGQDGWDTLRVLARLAFLRLD